MYLCLRDRCTSKEFEVGVNELGHECEEDGKTSLLPESIIENITKQDESHLAVIYYDDLTLSGNLDAQVYQKPVLLSDDLFALSFKTKVGRFYHFQPCLPKLTDCRRYGMLL